jgi:hypothetical protein
MVIHRRLQLSQAYGRKEEEEEGGMFYKEKL